MKFKREVKFVAAYDKRNCDPKKNYGIHGVQIWFILHGNKGAITFSVSTNWMLPHVQKEIDEKPFDSNFPYLFHKPMPFGVDYHSPIPIRNFRKKPSVEKCRWLKGKPCYCDGSATYGETVFQRLVSEGEKGLWTELEKWYSQVFDSKDNARAKDVV